MRWTLIVFFLRNFLKTHIGNENPESPEDEFNRVNRWSVSRFQHSYWLVLFTLQSRTEKSGKLLNFSPIFRIFAFLQDSWATKYVKLFLMLSINNVGLPSEFQLEWNFIEIFFIEIYSCVRLPLFFRTRQVENQIIMSESRPKGFQFIKQCFRAKEHRLRFCGFCLYLLKKPTK